MKERKVLKVISLCFVGLLLAFLITDTFCPGIWWVLKFCGTFRNANRVELYSNKTEQRITIEDKEDIKKLWKSMGILKAEQAEIPEQDMFAYIAYDIVGVELGFPIYIFANGVTLWGIPPEQDHYHYMPDLRDTVIDLCNKYNIEIDVNTSHEAEIETADFAD